MSPYERGQTLGRYRILRKVGSGAMGEVYLAEDPQIERRLAIKTVRLDGRSAEVEERRSRLLREAKAAGRLIHPNVVTLFDAGQAGKDLFLAFEFVDGQDLATLLHERPLTVGEALAIGRQTAAGLDFAHRQGIIHRDIKPSNLLVDPDGVVKISDFGIAKMAGQATELTVAGSVIGSPHYLSPEQVRGEDLDGRTDLFSLGVMLYELLSRKRPFRGETLTTLIYQILNEDPEPVEGLGPELAGLLERLVAKDRERRFPTAAAVVEEIRRLEESLPRVVIDFPLVLDAPPTRVMTGGIEAAAPSPPPPPTPPPAGEPPPVLRAGRGADDPEATRLGTGRVGAAVAASGAAARSRTLPLVLWIGGLAAAVVLVVASVLALQWYGRRLASSAAGPTSPAEASTATEGAPGGGAAGDVQSAPAAAGGDDSAPAGGTAADGEPTVAVEPQPTGVPSRNGADDGEETARPARATSPPPGRSSTAAAAEPAAADPTPAVSGGDEGAGGEADRRSLPVSPPPAGGEPSAAAADQQQPPADAGSRARPTGVFHQVVETGMSFRLAVEPPDAFVLLDGTQLGRAHDVVARGPISLPSPGPHVLILRRDGMLDARVLLQASESGRATSVRVRLERPDTADLPTERLRRVRARKGVVLRIQPRNAVLFVDGVRKGNASGLGGLGRWLRLDKGLHRLTLVAPGRQRVDLAVEIWDGAAADREVIRFELPKADR